LDTPPNAARSSSNMKIHKHTDSDFDSIVSTLVNRAEVDFTNHDETVRKILEGVRLKGDSALLEYTHRFDRHDFSLEKLRVTPEEFADAYNKVRPEQVNALKLAAENIIGANYSAPRNCRDLCSGRKSILSFFRIDERHTG